MGYFDFVFPVFTYTGLRLKGVGKTLTRYFERELSGCFRKKKKRKEIAKTRRKLHGELMYCFFAELSLYFSGYER